MNADRIFSAAIRLAAICTVAVGTGCWDNVAGPDEDERYVESIDRSVSAAGLRGLSIESENGSIEVSASAIDVVQVSVRKEVRASSAEAARDFAARVQVYVERDGDHLKVYHEHPEPPRGVTVQVDYDVRCPPDLASSLVTVNGGIDADGLSGAISAVTVNGGIVLDGQRGPVSLVTVNGNVHADIGNLSASVSCVTVNGSVGVAVRSGVGAVSAEAVNGNVSVRLHAGFGGRLDARTVHGSVSSTVTLSNALVSTTAVGGTIGSGGSAEVELRTENGDIEVVGL